MPNPFFNFGSRIKKKLQELTKVTPKLSGAGAKESTDILLNKAYGSNKPVPVNAPKQTIPQITAPPPALPRPRYTFNKDGSVLAEIPNAQGGIDRATYTKEQWSKYQSMLQRGTGGGGYTPGREAAAVEAMLKKIEEKGFARGGEFDYEDILKEISLEDQRNLQIEKLFSGGLAEEIANRPIEPYQPMEDNPAREGIFALSGGLKAGSAGGALAAATTGGISAAAGAIAPVAALATAFIGKAIAKKWVRAESVKGAQESYTQAILDQKSFIKLAKDPYTDKIALVEAYELQNDKVLADEAYLYQQLGENIASKPDVWASLIEIEAWREREKTILAPKFYAMIQSLDNSESDLSFLNEGEIAA